jgi:hypothetical protein
MNTLRKMLVVAMALSLAGLSTVVQAQRTYRVNEREVRQLLTRIESGTDVFKNSLDSALDQSRYDGSRREDNINQFVSDFETATDRLKDSFNRRRETKQEVEEVLNRGAAINSWLRQVRLAGGIQENWAPVRTDLTQLARLYNVTWNWNNTTYPASTQTYPVYNPGRPVRGLDRMTGTFRLDTTRSEDARTAAERATRTLPTRDRQRALDSLTARLESPESLALDRRGRNFTIASSRAPQVSFVADGRQNVETLDNGRQVRVTATLVGDELRISQVGDRGNDYSVTFAAIDNGRRLQVTRRISTARLTQPVVVESYYDKTSDVAQLDLYNGSPSYPGGTGTTTGSYGVPSGTILTAVLNDNLTTKDSRDNDRFTMTVTGPSQYDGATIEGYVTGVNRSGRITGRSEMTLNFERIRLRNGTTHRFTGFVETVRTANGETVRVDNEGNVQEGDSRGTTTAKRTAIGTAVGAIIGAIAGGGKGAAIGAIVGAGAGAGSVYVQGSDDLQLLSGTEVTIRSSGPS